MRLLLLFLLCLTASAQVASVVSTNALALRTPSSVNPVVLVAPADGSEWELWRYAPASTSSDWDNALVTTTGTGRWLNVPLTGLLANVVVTGGSLDVETITSDTFTGGEYIWTTPFTGTEPDNHLASFGWTRNAIAPAVADNLTDLLAVTVYPISRWAYVIADGTFWVYCPDETTADNGDDIRRPDSIVSDATPGRWTRISLAGGGGGITDGDKGDITVSSSGTVWNIDSGVVTTTELGGDITAAGETLLTAADAAAQRTALSLVVGTNVQAYDADLTTYAGITPSANVQTLLGAANYGAFRTSLGVAIGTDVQAYDADLTTYAGITPSANVQTLLGAANYAAFKTSLSLNNVENTALSTWAGSSAITTLGTISSGTVPVARVSGLATVATSGSAADLGSGTLPDARFPATLPAASGANLTALNAGNLSSGTVASARLPSPGRPVTYVVDNSGTAITAGDSTIAAVPVEVTGTITKAVLIADQSGSAVVDVFKATYSGWPTVSSIAASAKPTLSAAQKSQDTTLTGWTTSVTAGDILQFRVDSASTVTRLTLVLTITPP